MRAVIFAGGDFPWPQEARRWLRPEDWILAADGGAVHCQALGLHPAVLIGDLDSLDPQAAEAQRSAGVEIILHPRAKDETDLELAAVHAVRGGADEIVIFGAFGGRWDHTLANFLLAAHPALRHLRLTFTDGRRRAWVIPDEAEVSGSPGDLVSLLPIGGDAHGISTTGLEYALQNGSLLLGSSRGVSNVLVDSPAHISVREGLLLLVVSPREGEGGSP